MALIGCAQVSTAEQDTALQTDALRQTGCERTFEDTASGAKTERPGPLESSHKLLFFALFINSAGYQNA